MQTAHYMAQMSAPSEGIWGKRVVVTPHLPIEPTFPEQMRRRVRHGLADVLEWLGEDVGPRPESPVGVITTPDTLFVSQEVYDLMCRTEDLVRGVTR